MIQKITSQLIESYDVIFILTHIYPTAIIDIFLHCNKDDVATI